MSKNVSQDFFADLTANQRKAAVSLLDGNDKTEAAETAGITSRTLDRWLQDDKFRRCLSTATGAELGIVASRLTGAMQTAVSVLIDMLNDEEATPASRRLAAVAILEHGQRLYELQDLAGRVAALEAKITNEQH